MRELSLFSGAGGGLLGTRLLRWRQVGYVEIDDYCQRVIAARIRDGILPDAPIFGDIRAFISDGFAASYQGLVDVVTAGFPCQPFSIAGRRQGEMDDRNMWPATLDVLRIVRPQWCLLENVPGLLATRYFGAILSDLAEAGFDARWEIISAAEAGAPHLRKRLWIVANAQGNGRQPWRTESMRKQGRLDAPERGDVSDAQGEQVGAPGQPRERCGVVPDADGKRRKNGNGLRRRVNKIKRGGWWATEPGICRVAHGVANRVDRVKALGNGQVPAVAREAWRRLTT